MYNTESTSRTCHAYHYVFILGFTIVFLSLSTEVSAQNPEWVVYNTKNSGLPGNTVYDLANEGVFAYRSDGMMEVLHYSSTPSAKEIKNEYTTKFIFYHFEFLRHFWHGPFRFCGRL
ncbi:MAG: hypothetical protein GY801_10075 [bacterium]|nr:hypothetical protein [bacterium]